MRKILYILIFIFICISGLFSQYPDGNGVWILGGSSRNITIDIDSSLRMHDTTTCWEDSQVPALAITIGVTAPTLTDGFAGSASLETYYFQGGGSTNDQCWFTIQLSHTYREGSAIYPHVHWSPTTDVASGSDTTVWELVYTWQSINGTPFASPTTITCKSAGGTNAQWDHKVAEFDAIVGTGQTISSILVCRLRRLNSDASDTYGANAAFLGFDIHYEVDSFGSRMEFEK